MCETYMRSESMAWKVYRIDKDGKNANVNDMLFEMEQYRLTEIDLLVLALNLNTTFIL